MACRTYARTLVISTAGGLAVIPNREAVRTSWATFAAFNSALLGTQPVQVQSPPIRFFSASATLAPSFAANRAATSPPEPAPITTRSYRSCVMRSPPSRVRQRAQACGRTEVLLSPSPMCHKSDHQLQTLRPTPRRRVSLELHRHSAGRNKCPSPRRGPLARRLLRQVGQELPE